jgi:hypothetical protein
VKPPSNWIDVDAAAMAAYVVEREMSPNVAAIFKGLVHSSDPNTGLCTDLKAAEKIARRFRRNLGTLNWHYRIQALHSQHGAIAFLRSEGLGGIPAWYERPTVLIADWLRLVRATDAQAETVAEAHARILEHPRTWPVRPIVYGTSLYRMWNYGGDLLYVGIASDPGKRFDQHSRYKRWWHEVDTIKVIHYPTRAEARAAELVAIRSESPRYNVADAPKVDESAA